ncbi:TPA: DoxX family protein [Vibrio parahaemolyticus]
MIFFDRLKQPSYLIFRITTGFMFFCHGTQKLIGFPVEFPYKLNALTLTAGVIETIAGLLVMIGFYSRFSAFIASGTMAVAYWMMHGTNNPYPIANGGEVAAFYCFAFLYIAAKGPGICSINKK